MPTERRPTRSTKAVKPGGANKTTNTKLPAAIRTPKKNTALIVGGGVGGGAVVLLLIIAAASSGGGRRQPDAPTGSVPTKTPPPVVQRGEQRNTTSNTGPIMFICAGASNHEDKEVILSTCPACKAVDQFHWDSGQYVCAACRKAFDNAKVVCPQCGKVPRTHRIKHR